MFSFSTKDSFQLESCNYITLINPTYHPSRIFPYHDLLYLLEGSWEIEEDGIRYFLQPGDLIFLQAFHAHNGTKPCSSNTRHMYLHLYPDPVPSNQAISNTPSYFLPTKISCQANPKIRQLFEEIIDCTWNQTTLKEQKQSLLIQLLLCELYTTSQATETAKKTNEIILSINQLLLANPQHTFTCTEIADRFFICERTLSNLYKQFYGETFYTYQKKLKLKMVHQYMMDHPNEGLHNIALNFGFCDEFHLGKAYKKQYGTSPKHHRA